MDGVASGFGYAGKLKTRHRLLAWHGDQLVALMWFSVGFDGSLYCGPYVKKADVNAVASGVIKGGEFVSYDSLNFLSAGDNPTKTSFHASGHIHYDRKRAFRDSFVKQHDTVKICEIFLTQPTTKDLKNKGEVRKTDIVSNFVVDMDAPCVCHVLYSVGKSHKLYNFGPNEWKSVISYPNLDRVGDVSLEIAISQCLGQAWPKHSLIVFEADPDKKSV